MKIKIDKFVHFSICILMLIFNTILCAKLEPDYNGIAKAEFIQLIIFIIGYLSLAKANKSIISLYGVFLLVFFFFQNGQVLLYVLGFKYDFFYVEKYEKSYLLESIIFSTNCLCAAMASGIFSVKRKKRKNILINRINNISKERIIQYGKVFLCLFGIFALPYMFIKFIITLKSGYYSMIAFVSKMPTWFNLIEKLFIGFSILMMVYIDNKKTIHKLITGTVLIWSMMAAFTGDRTVGLAGLVTIAMINFLIGNRINKKNSFSKYIKLGTVGIIVVYLISIVFSFRMQSGIEKMNVMNACIGAIGTLGFSFFPLVLVMRTYPSVQSYMYGKSFIGGLISGLIPQNIDLLNITDIFNRWSSEGTDFIDSYYNYGFGIDFSLNAECYINFGKYGWIAMFFVCAIIASFLRQINFKDKSDLIEQYTGIVLLYSWFTLPRRKSYYIFNNILWYVVVVEILLIVFDSLKNKLRSSNNRS